MGKGVEERENEREKELGAQEKRKRMKGTAKRYNRAAIFKKQKRKGSGEHKEFSTSVSFGNHSA